MHNSFETEHEAKKKRNHTINTAKSGWTLPIAYYYKHRINSFTENLPGFLFPSQDKYVNTNEYDGSREELWGKPKILYRDFRFIFFSFILTWTASLKIYDRYDENIFFFLFRWDKNTDPHATCKLNSMRTPIKTQALPFWFVCFLKRNDNPVQQDKICWGKAHNLNGNKRTKGKKMRERLCIPLL